MKLSYREDLSLESAIRHILEECRMVLPGIQALFGFQLIAVFNDSFGQKLSATDQRIHFVSIILTVVAVALVMTPAALHRQIDPLSVTLRLVKSSTNLLLLSMFPLALSISLEIYLIGQIVLGLRWLALAAALAALLLFLSLWIFFPIKEKTALSAE